MVESEFEITNDGRRLLQNASLQPNNPNDTTPVSWIGHPTGNSNLSNIRATAGNDKSPIKVDTSHPLWQTFLDSGTMSPLAFFRVFLSPPTYFHSPTPWTRSTRFVQKVQELLESFSPGTYIYQPFQKETIHSNLNEPSNHNNEYNQVSLNQGEDTHVVRNLTNDTYAKEHESTVVNEQDMFEESNANKHCYHILKCNETDVSENKTVINVTLNDNDSRTNNVTAPENILVSTRLEEIAEINGPETLTKSQHITDTHVPSTKIFIPQGTKIENQDANSSPLIPTISTPNTSAGDHSLTNIIPPSLLSTSSPRPWRTNHITTSTTASFSQLEIELDESRQRLYVDTGRPRPFRREYETNLNAETDTSNAENIQEEEITVRSYQESYFNSYNVSNHQARTLQDLAKITLLKRLGLDGLHELLNSNNKSDMSNENVCETKVEYLKHQLRTSSLPQMLKDRVLTFHCDDFEEVTSEEHQESKIDDGMSANIRGTASFKVRCIHDGQIYTATFFTSEMDKEVSNIWEEYREFLSLPDHLRKCMIEILALVADPLAQNVFLVTRCYSQSMRQHISAIKNYTDNGSDGKFPYISRADVVTSIKKCRDDMKEVYRNMASSMEQIYYKDPKYNKSDIQRRGIDVIEPLLDQLLVLNKPVQTKGMDNMIIHVDNPLLSKDWKSKKSQLSSFVATRYPPEVFTRLISHIHSI